MSDPSGFQVTGDIISVRHGWGVVKAREIAHKLPLAEASMMLDGLSRNEWDQDPHM
jgi:hypothetical protein